MKICTIFGAPGKREKETKFSFSLLILSSFLATVRRFLSESYTDMSLLLAYGKVDVHFIIITVLFLFCKPKGILRCTN